MILTPRPYQISTEVNNVVTDEFYGSPSGHAQNATVLGGGLAAEIRRKWILWTAVILCAIRAVSRLILGVHFPQDVIAGLLVGIAFVAGYIFAEPRIVSWAAKASIRAQLGAVVGTFLLLMIISPGLVSPESAPWFDEPMPHAELIRWAVTQPHISWPWHRDHY